jgi:transposase InsO family protein
MRSLTVVDIPLDYIQSSPLLPPIRAMGIRGKPIAPGSPWQNGYAERLIGTLRRECLDHMIVFGEAHLRRILGKYVAYYNRSRIHRAPNKDAHFPARLNRQASTGTRPIEPRQSAVLCGPRLFE